MFQYFLLRKAGTPEVKVFRPTHMISNLMSNYASVFIGLISVRRTVTIAMLLVGQSPPARQIKMALGSGFFVSSDGYAVTNDHVVEHGVSFVIATDDGTTYTAKVVGADLRTDLALLKADGRNDFPYVRFANHEPRIGDWIIAVGNPYGLGGTVTDSNTSCCEKPLLICGDDFRFLNSVYHALLGSDQEDRISLSVVCRSEDLS